MWYRLKRLIKSLFGFLLSKSENPEILLKQSLRELEEKIPKLNENIAMMKASISITERELEKIYLKEKEYEEKIKEALSVGKRDIALEFAEELDIIREEKSKLEGELSEYKKAYQEAVRLKEQYLREKEKKAREILKAIRHYKQAKIQSEIANALQSFSLESIDYTHKDMLQRIEEEKALSKARLDIALEDLKGKRKSMDREMRLLKAKAILQEFEKKQLPYKK
jgi:phage shock protein A